MSVSSVRIHPNQGETVLFMLNGFITAQGRELRAGDAVVVIRTGERGWMLVRDSKGQKSWVPQSYVQPVFHERQDDLDVLNSLQVESEVEIEEHGEGGEQHGYSNSVVDRGALVHNGGKTQISQREGGRRREGEREGERKGMRKEEDEQALQRSWDVVAGSVAYVEDIMQQVEMSLLRMQKMHEEELNALLNRFEGKIASLEDVADTRLVVEVEAELRREREMHRKELEQVYLEVSNLKEERSRLLRRIEGMESEKLRSELGHGRSQDSLSSASRFHTSSSHLPPGREPSERIQTLEKSISEMMRSLEEKDQEIRLLSRGDSHERQRAKMSEAGEEEKILLDFEQMKKSNADLNMLVQGYKEKVKKMEKMLEDERSKSQVDSSSNFGLRSVLELEVENTALKQLLRENEEHRSKGDEEEVKKLREANLSLQETLANLQEEFMSLRTQHDALLAAPVGSASAQGQARPQDLIGIARWSSGGAEERLKDVRESDKLPRSPAIGGALSSSSSTITSSKRNLVGLIV